MAGNRIKCIVSNVAHFANRLHRTVAHDCLHFPAVKAKLKDPGPHQITPNANVHAHMAIGWNSYFNEFSQRIRNSWHRFHSTGHKTKCASENLQTQSQSTFAQSPMQKETNRFLFCRWQSARNDFRECVCVRARLCGILAFNAHVERVGNVRSYYRDESNLITALIDDLRRRAGGAQLRTSEFAKKPICNRLDKRKNRIQIWDTPVANGCPESRRKRDQRFRPLCSPVAGAEKAFTNNTVEWIRKPISPIHM